MVAWYVSCIMASLPIQGTHKLFLHSCSYQHEYTRIKITNITHRPYLVPLRKSLASLHCPYLLTFLWFFFFLSTMASLYIPQVTHLFHLITSINTHFNMFLLLYISFSARALHAFGCMLFVSPIKLNTAGCQHERSWSRE